MERIPLKIFWEAVEQRLRACSTDELRAILRAMAQETPPTGRQAFLDKLKPLAETAAVVEQALRQDDLLADIDDFIHELQAEMKDADYYEERYGWGGYGEYDEEDSLGPYEDFVEPLTELFDRAEAVFDYGNSTLARAAYQKLFKALDLEDDYGRGISAHDLVNVDIGEARDRYLRAVYETEAPAYRPQALFEHMRQVQSRLFKRPLLDGIIQISPRLLPDQERFLRDWIAFLRKQSGGDADAWLREAIRLSQGTQGLAELAQREGKQRPRAYLDWFVALEEEGEYREVLTAAQDALQTLPDSLPIRAALADHLCAAAARLNEAEALRSGRWEAFAAKPTLARLLDLWDVASTSEERAGLMQQAAQHAKDDLARPSRHQQVEVMEVWVTEDSFERPAWISKSVLAHAYLFAKDWDAARNAAAGEKVLGWSSSDNPQGLVIPFFLVLLSGRLPSALPPNLAQHWQWGLQNSSGVGYWSVRSIEDDALKRLECAYAELLSTISLRDGQQEQLLSWCLDVAEQRANAIVSNQHRKSYNKAAVLMTACAEVLRLRKKAKEAEAVLDGIRNRFPRHRAFQAELRAAVQRMERSQFL